MSGWIVLHRSINDHWLSKQKRVYSDFEAWIDLLLTVNHAPSKVNIKGVLFEVGRGESVCSLSTWADRWGWDKSRVRRFLKLLQSDHMIDTKSERKTTRITICNYDSYQRPRNDGETMVKRKRNDGETMVTPNKECKEYNKIDTNVSISMHPLVSWLNENCSSVQKMKSPITNSEAENIMADFPDKEAVKSLFLEMENYKSISTKYVSANLTFRNWANRRKKENPTFGTTQGPTLQPRHEDQQYENAMAHIRKYGKANG